MPGTIQGESGWYMTATDTVSRYDVHASQWTSLEGPMTEAEWRSLRKQELNTLDMQRQKTLVLEQEQFKQGEAATRIQSIQRGLSSRDKVRRVKLGHYKEAGFALAMPGTTQGSSGWYQTETKVTRYEVDGTGGEWTKAEGPIDEKEWYQRRKDKRKESRKTERDVPA